MVRELGLAVEIKMDYRKDLGIERGISYLMESDNQIRKRVKEISQKSRKALINNSNLIIIILIFILQVNSH
ncbi:hypothetical protein ACOSP7_012683 [Xanthoceras sorbifolium]